MKNLIKDFLSITVDVFFLAVFGVLCFAFMEAIVDGRSLWLLAPTIFSAWGCLIAFMLLCEKISNLHWKKKSHWED